MDQTELFFIVTVLWTDSPRQPMPEYPIAMFGCKNTAEKFVNNNDQTYKIHGFQTIREAIGFWQNQILYTTGKEIAYPICERTWESVGDSLRFVEKPLGN